MALQISTTIDLLNCGVSFYLAVRLYRAWQQDPASQTLKNFAYTYGFLTAAFAILFVPRIFASAQTDLLGYCFAFGNFCFLLASAFFGRIVLQFTKPGWKRPFMMVFLPLSLAGLVLALVQRAQPVVDATTGITQWNAQFLPGVLSAALLIAVLIPGATLFLLRGLQTRDNHVVRVRSLTIGAGGFLLVCTAATFYLAGTETMAILSDFLSIAALLTVFLGVLYHRPRPLPHNPLPPHTLPT